MNWTGREQGPRGGDMGADYNGKQLVRMGLKPAGDNLCWKHFFQGSADGGREKLGKSLQLAEAQRKSFEAQALIDFVTKTTRARRRLAGHFERPIVFCGLWPQRRPSDDLGRLHGMFRPSWEQLRCLLRERAQPRMIPIFQARRWGRITAGGHTSLRRRAERRRGGSHVDHPARTASYGWRYAHFRGEGEALVP